MACKESEPRPTCMGVVDKALSLQRAGCDVVHLEKGEPDFDTPAVVVESAVRALREGRTRYTTSVGLLELREAICAHYLRTYGEQVDPDRVIVASGSSPALLTVFLTLLSPGDDVILPDPTYPSYRRLIETAGGRPVHVPTREHGFRYTAEAVAGLITPRTRAIVVNFPSNPLGTTADRRLLAELAGLGPTVVSDEVYHGLSYTGRRDPSALEVADDAIVVNSFSKAFAMTGWRLGYSILPPELARRARPIQQDSFVCANTFVQWAAIDALANAAPIVAGWREELRHRRDVLVAGLDKLGFEIPVRPDGAFYTFAKLPLGHTDSYSFAAGLLDELHVAVTPGPEFGPGGEGYLRFSYATSVDQIQVGLARIGQYLEES